MSGDYEDGVGAHYIFLRSLKTARRIEDTNSSFYEHPISEFYF